MAYTPSRRMPRCRPFCPPWARNLRASWKLLHSTISRQGLRGLELLAAAGEDVADLALLDGDQRELVNGILPAPQSEVEAAAEDVGLVAGLAVQGDDRAFRQRPGGWTRAFPRCRCGRWGYSGVVNQASTSSQDEYHNTDKARSIAASSMGSPLFDIRQYT